MHGASGGEDLGQVEGVGPGIPAQVVHACDQGIVEDRARSDAFLKGLLGAFGLPTAEVLCGPASTSDVSCSPLHEIVVS